MVSAANLQKGMILKINSQPWLVVDFQFVNPGKGSAFSRTKLKNLKTGNVTEQTFKSNEEFEEIELESKKAVFLYNDRRSSVFLLKDNNQRMSLPLEITQDKVAYLKQNSEIDLIYHEEELLSLNIPIKVELKVTEALPGVKGNTVSGAMKKVKLETGLEIDVPLFVEEGDLIRINTKTGEYTERAKE